MQRAQATADSVTLCVCRVRVIRPGGRDIWLLVIKTGYGATWVHANYFSGLPSTQKKSPGCRAKTRVAVAGPMDSVVRSCPSWELRHGAESATH